LPNLFIHGSCLSRDTRPFLGDDWTLIEYVARQGFISAAAGPTDLDGESKLTSSFQNRCLRNDILGTLLPTLKERASEIDLVVMDLVDERLGVYRTSDGGYITHSWELEGSGLLDGREGDITHIAFGADEHFELWCAAADKITAAICRRGLLAVVLAPAWAARADNGGGGFDYRNIPADVWNAKYERYFDRLETLGLKVIRVPSASVTASISHQWGLAPYHYVDRVYNTMQQQIKDYYAANCT